MIQKTWHLDMSDLNFELQPSIHIQIWRAFPTQTAPTEYSQALRRLLPNGAPDLNFFEDFWGHQNPWLEGIEDFWHLKSEMNTNIYTITCILYSTIWSLMMNLKEKRYGNHSNYVGSSFHSCTQLWIRGCNNKHHLVPNENPPDLFNGQFSVDETSWKSMLPSATHFTHQPINLSSGISPKLMHCATGDDFFETSANRRLDHLHYVWNLQKFLPMSWVFVGSFWLQKWFSVRLVCHASISVWHEETKDYASKKPFKNITPGTWGKDVTSISTLLCGVCRLFDRKSWTSWWLRGILSILTMATTQDLYTKFNGSN